MPYNMEISHLAEGYHNTAGINQWQPGMKIELTVAEDYFANEGRTRCFKTAAIWWNGVTGEQLKREELPYFGPTLCPHMHAGLPCLTPLPLLGKS